MGSSRKPYNERTDIEKIHSQWTKLVGLHEREEWSAAIMRAATAAEIAANTVVRREFSARSTFDSDFVDSLLKWANGLSGKMQRLVLQFPSDDARKTELAELSRLAGRINEKRNQVAHSGNFSNKKEARDVESNARKFIENLLAPYEPDFKLKQLKITSKSAEDEI